MADQIQNKWEEAIADLHTWTRAGRRAVHKPLFTLILLARAARGESPRMSYTDIDPLLLHLLKKFGPSQKIYHPEYPFWHLQTDGFWVVEQAEDYHVAKGGSPTRSQLKDRDAVGSVPDELWSALQDEGLVWTLCQRILHDFWPVSYHDDICQAVGLSGYSPDASVKPRKRRDPNFRIEVIRAYERRCAICGYDGRLGDDQLALEAAHIRWHSYNGPDIIENGMALCSFHHVAFDRGAIGLSADRTVLTSSDISGSNMVEDFLLKFSGAPLRLPQTAFPPPDPKYIEWHNKNVFKSPAREGSYAYLGRVAEERKTYRKKNK